MATRKNPTTATTKKTTAPIVVDENIPVSQIELSNNQLMSISLLRSKSNRYIAISRMYKTKGDSDSKPGKGIWLPFDHAKTISEIIAMAYDKGLELEWDKPFVEPEIQSPPENNDNKDIVQAIDEVQVALDKLKKTIESGNKEKANEQLSLFSKLTNSLFK